MSTPQPMRVLRSVPLAAAIMASGAVVLNGNAADPSIFKVDGPDTEAVPDTVPLTTDCSVEAAIKTVKSKTRMPLGDYYDLLAYAQNIAPNKNIIALGSVAEIGGVMMSPYVSTHARKPSIYLKRHDITLGSEFEVLVVEQVSVR